jgi:UDP-N-acetylmuramoyl-tripeptide--D-alanyl-D-alanine ligase
MLTLAEAAQALNAERRGRDTRFTRVTTDSRAVAPGDLFVALRGERFDGHAFVAEALDKGAVAAMVAGAEAARRGAQWAGIPLLVVEDTRLGLGALAGFWRARFPGRIVAVTGSNGKTTVKEMIAGILRAQTGDAGQVAVTPGNLNNDIGMPLTLLGMGAGQQFAVIEMGMNHPGEIAYLTSIARPHVAVINNAQAAHLAGLGSLEQVARAKGEIFQGLGAQGVAVINGDDPHAALWQALAGERKVIRFGLRAEAEVRGTYAGAPFGSAVEMITPEGRFSVALPVPGEHNVRNALAAAAAAVALGISNGVIGAGLEAFSGVSGRLQRKRGLHGATLIDDTYNANPGSVRAAIGVLAAAPGKKILVLGDMGELGDAARELHGEIGALARESGVDVLLALGELARSAAEGFGRGARHFEYIEDLLAELENLLAPEVTVLVKGSRFMRMERVVRSFES